jgi:hypothetical protein
MATRFEIVLKHGRLFYLQLRIANGEVVLHGLSSTSKIMTQNEILRLRKAVEDDTRFVPHANDDGTNFLIIKHTDGTVLAKSVARPSLAELDELALTIRAAANAPMIDLSKQQRSNIA